MASAASHLAISVDVAGTTPVLTVGGVLDSSSYRGLRDSVIKAALDEPDAVIVDVTALDVPARSAWSVFTSARWHVNTWPDVPIMLVCGHAAGRAAIARAGVIRYVPLHPTIADARDAVAAGTGRRARRRAKTELTPNPTSLAQAGRLVAEWLSAWSQGALIPTASVVADVFVDNVVQHTDSAPTLVLESNDDAVTVAVQDNSPRPAQRREDPIPGCDTASGLAIVAAVSRAWGSMPTPSGKTVWAVIGPENRL